MSTLMTRRCWLQLAGGAVVEGGVSTAWHRSRQRSVRLGLIGAGRRGRQLANSIHSTGWYDVRGEIVSICDADHSRAEAVRQKYAPAAETTQDFRRVLERDDVAAVFVVTPNHWHAPIVLEALRHGKHVYCEKPLALTIAEGQQIVEAVRDSGRTFQVGTQQRSFWRFHLACDLVRHGRLGTLKRIAITLPPNQIGGPFTPQSPPESLDWERWLGPAPAAAYCPERYQGFYWWNEYSGGSLTDWGTHHLDIAQWAMGLDTSGPIRVEGEATMPVVDTGYNHPQHYSVEYQYANGVALSVKTSATENSLVFEGDEGRILVNRRRLTGKPVDDLINNPLPADAERFGHRKSYWSSYEVTHIRHFFDCLLTGQTPISDVVSQHRAATACHLGNIALRLGRAVTWDPLTEQFPNDPEASAWLARSSRSV